MSHDSTLPSWQQARDLAAGAVLEPMPAETVDLSDGDRRTLAVDQVALTSLPPYETSAMDGWAVCGRGPWPIVGKVLAGSIREEPLFPGTAVVIATGAVIPTNTTGIVRREHGSVTDHGTTVQGTTADNLGPRAVLHADEPDSGADIRPAAAECTVGEVLATAGTAVSPAMIGLLAAAGQDTLDVRVKPTAALLVLGDELLEAGLPSDGQVRDSLGPQVPAWLVRLGVLPILTTRVRDTLAAHTEAIAEGLRMVDMMFTTGGTAAGPVDHLHTAIAELGGELVVDSVASRPGHPMLLASFDFGPRRKWLVGLPGNPQSAIVALLTLGQPVVMSLLGSAIPPLDSVRAARDVPAPKDEDRLVLGTVRHGRFHQAEYLGSAMLRGLASATGFAIVPPNGVAANESLRWLPLP
jgi:molybdopterin molybdotransferase